MKTDAPPISLGYATRHVRRIVEVFTWLHRTGVLTYNPLLGLSFGGYQDKPVEPLSMDQLTRLEQLALEGPPDAARWWFLLMCYTGLDYRDARAYVNNPAHFERETPEGLTIQGSRAKTGLRYCVPKVRQVEALLTERPDGAHPYALQKLNDLLQKKIAPIIGFQGRMTTKTARKTAAEWFAENEFNIAEISGLLGHSKQDTTERYYFRVSNRTVISGMKRTGITKK